MNGIQRGSSPPIVQNFVTMTTTEGDYTEKKMQEAMVSALASNSQSNQRTQLKAIARNSHKKGSACLTWIKVYCEINQVDRIFEPNEYDSLTRKQALALMNRDMRLAEESIDDKLHEKLCNDLMFCAIKADVPVIDWIIAYYSKKKANPELVTPPAPMFKCPTPTCTFEHKNQQGLNGHKVKSCFKKYQQSLKNQ